MVITHLFTARDISWPTVGSLDLYSGTLCFKSFFARSHIIKCVFLSSVVFVLDLNLSVCFLDFINIAFCWDGNTTLNMQSTNHFFRAARWLSGRVSDSGARGRGFDTYRRRVVSLSKTLYSPKVLVNYPGSGGSVPTWLKNCWLGRSASTQTNKLIILSANHC